MASYKVASEEGAQLYGAELGDTVDLDLSPEDELPLVAAGWLEPADTKKTKEAKS